jgi:aspartyl-tRNA synthetase
MRHEDTLVELCGEDLAVEDLRYLRQEDLDQIAATMSFVEARRLNDGIEQLKKSTLASAQSED